MSETPCLAANATARQAKPLRAARANRVFCTDKKRIRTENAVMQLLRNNCHIRANVFVILVAANGRVKQLLRNNCHIRANVFVILVAASGRAKVNPGRSAIQVAR